MKEVVIGSKNPVKIRAVKIGFAKMFPNEQFEFTGISVSSNVADQPMNDKETLSGALNRVTNTAAKVKDADYVVGLEGGIEVVEGELMAYAWIVVQSGNKFGKSRTATFFLPKEVAKLIENGKELGEADDIVFRQKDSKRQNGAVGILTGNVVDRANLYAEAVALSLIPFRNESLF